MQGAEAVERAASRMGDAADRMQRAAGEIGAAVDRLERLVERLEMLKASGEEPEGSKPEPSQRGTVAWPCEDCGQTSKGNTEEEGWYRCNACGYPGK